MSPLCEGELTVQFIHVLKLGSLKGQFTRRTNVIWQLQNWVSDNSEVQEVTKCHI